MPLHIVFRETVGLSNRIITKGQRTSPNSPPLFLADLYTLFPCDERAAGEGLGQLFGTVQSGGLTPGHLGGTYINYGE